jgi:hypothetical protein
MNSALWGVVIGGAIGLLSALSAATVNNIFAVRREKEARAHDQRQERIKWAREHNLPIYGEVTRLGRILADRVFRDESEREVIRAFRTALSQLRIVASADVRRVAEEYETNLLRYQTTANRFHGGVQEGFNDSEAAYNIWEDAERRLYHAIYQERGDEAMGKLQTTTKAS